MPLVQMSCKNCGAPLKREGDGYICAHCGTAVANVLDVAIDPSRGILTQAEFEEAVRARRALFTAEHGVLRVFDGQTEVCNAQLRQAERLVRQGKFYAVDEALRGVPDTIFAAERLRLLAEIGARDEAELSCWSGDLRTRAHFERLYASGGFEQKRLYDRIASSCAENERIGREIARGRALLRAQAYEDAEHYAAVMCAQYPLDARAWELLIAARCGKDADYDPQADLAFFLGCPNRTVLYGEALEGEALPRSIAPVISDRARAVAAHRHRKGAFLRKLLTGLAVLGGVGILALLWTMIDSLVG